MGVEPTNPYRQSPANLLDHWPLPPTRGLIPKSRTMMV